MHLLNHHDSQHSRTLALYAAYGVTPAAPAPTMAAKLVTFCRWLKARRDYYAEEMAAFEYGDHPDADHCRIREDAAQVIMDKLEALGLQLPGWAAKAPAVERPCSITTPAPLAPDICHGQEVPPPAAVQPWTASPLRTPLVPEGYASRGQGENVRAGDLIWSGGGNIWERVRPGNFGRSAAVFYAVARPI